LIATLLFFFITVTVTYITFFSVTVMNLTVTFYIVIFYILNLFRISINFENLWFSIIIIVSLSFNCPQYPRARPYLSTFSALCFTHTHLYLLSTRHDSRKFLCRTLFVSRSTIQFATRSRYKSYHLKYLLAFSFISR